MAWLTQPCEIYHQFILVHFLKTSLLSFFLFVLEWLMDSLSLSHSYRINTALKGHVFCVDHRSLWRSWRRRRSVLYFVYKSNWRFIILFFWKVHWFPPAQPSQSCFLPAFLYFLPFFLLGGVCMFLHKMCFCSLAHKSGNACFTQVILTFNLFQWVSDSF